MSPHALPHIRIFLSSPGDLTDERAIARKVIEQVGYDPAFYGKVTFEVVAWEQEGSEMFMPATLPPQEAINRGLPRPAECDLVIVMLWTRMGTPLPFPEYQKPGGTQYLSGTEYEYLDALEAAQKTGQPLVVVYQRTQKVMLDPDDPKIEDKLKQQRHVKAFFEAFHGPDGTLRQSYHQYETPEDFRTHFERALRRFVVDFQSQPINTKAKPAATVETPPLWPGSPFPGLRAFTPDDAPIFFGRGRETDALIKRVTESRFVAVVGASGSGKSSLVGAGLIPRLKDNAISGEHLGSKDWRIVSFKPGEKEGDPFRALADALVVAFPSLIPSPLEAKRLKDEFVAALKADPASLVDTCTAALAHDPAWAETLLFIDQFEELFTVVDEALRAPFVDLLNSVAQGARLRTVVTMRADFYHACLKYKALEELLRAGSFPLGAPGQIALGEMITRPAERSGLQWEDSYLPERILQDTGSEPGNLALMAYTLDELYEVCCADNSGLLSHQRYDDLGGVQGAIGTRAEHVFASLDPDAQATLPLVFRELVEVDERGTATRQRAPLARFETNDAAGRLLRLFTDARLLTASGGNAEAVVEVAHEALFRNWDRLAAWIDATQADLFLLRQLRQAVQLWEQSTFRNDFLWTGQRLKDAQAMVSRLQPRLSEVEHDFLRSEVERLEERLKDPALEHPTRAKIGEQLHIIGDTRPGVGLRQDGLPDIAWCVVPGGKIEIVEQTFTIQPFYIARYPITFMQFQAFLDDPGGWDQDEWWQGLGHKRQDRFEQRFKFANHPRENVSWYQAVAFTRWLTAKLPQETWTDTAALNETSAPRGGLGRLLGRTPEVVKWQIRLPAEWEWQYAATGGNPANEYPWGPDWENGRRCNTTESGLSRTTAVGMYPHGAATCGALDISGNVFEWCLNEYEKPANAGTAGDALRVLRGGSFYGNQARARAVYRFRYSSYLRYAYCGFRVVCASPI